MFVRRRTQALEAIRWNRHGDHLDVMPYTYGDTLSELECPDCGQALKDHGWLPSLRENTGRRVCPGMWIVQTEYPEVYNCYPDDLFKEFFEPVPDLEV